MKKSPGTNNSQMGGASPHNHYIAIAIVRSAGDATSASFCENRTRSPYKATDKQYDYISAGEGWGGNVKR